MGLHICYELRLPGSVADMDALRLLISLRSFAASLDVHKVTDVMTLTGHELQADRKEHAVWSLEWWVRVTAHGVHKERDGQQASISDPARVAAAAFLVNLGRGSEPAMFGLVRPLKTTRPHHAEAADEWQNWFWHYCCKTQYASVVSDDHLFNCHTAVIRILEEAERLGVGITVRDETHYWETRSRERLIAEVNNMNRIVARFAGALSDKMTPDASVEGSIFEHKSFEHLEVERIEPLGGEKSGG